MKNEDFLLKFWKTAQKFWFVLFFWFSFYNVNQWGTKEDEDLRRRIQPVAPERGISLKQKVTNMLIHQRKSNFEITIYRKFKLLMSNYSNFFFVAVIVCLVTSVCEHSKLFLKKNSNFFDVRSTL